MPRTTISSLFGPSPIRPLQTQMARVITCVRELHPFMEAVLANDWEQVRSEQKKSLSSNATPTNSNASCASGE